MSSPRILAEQALPGIGRTAGARGRQPGLPQRPLADHLAQIEPVAVEVELDQPALAALQAQAAVELGAAQLARRVGQLELAVADGGVGHEAELAGRGLSRHVAVAHRPAGERLELRAVELDRTDKHRTELAAGEAARGLDAVIAGEHGLEALDRERAVFAGEREIDRADQIAAKSRLLDGDTSVPSPNSAGLAEHLVGEHIKHRGGRGPLLGARHREQRIEIDEARRKLGLGGHAVAEIERELALEDLRMPVGMDGEIEIGQLGALGRGGDRALQFVARGLVTRRGVGRLRRRSRLPSPSSAPSAAT